MLSGGTATPPTGPDDLTPEAAGHPELNILLNYWEEVGALAWKGFLTKGTGYVLLTIDDWIVLPSFVPGSPCECCPIDASTYDPKTQAVVVKRQGDRQTGPLTVTGYPSPPEMFARATADVTRATVH